MDFKQGALWLGAAFGIFALPTGAVAQQVVDTRMENDTAASRLRPEYDQPGIPAGPFLLFPTLGAEASYNDNIYARSDIRNADEVLALRPVVEAKSQWTRNEVDFHGQAEVDRYATHASEDVVTWSVAGSGRFELGSRTTLSGDAQFASNIEERGSTGDTLFGAKPVAYGQVTANIKLEQVFDVTRLTLSGHLDRYRYVPRALDGTLIDLAYRDYTYLEAKARVARAISPGVAAYVDLELDDNTYAFYVPSAGQRDSTQYAALVGFAFGINRLLQGEAAVGYFHRTFRGNADPAIGGLDYNLALAWSPTRLTTINLTADKAYQRTPMLGVAGFEQQDVALSLVHELLRNLLLRPGLAYSLAQYVDAPFHDRFASAQFTATWLIGPHWQMEATATHRLGRFSDPSLAARNFNQNRVSVALTYRF
jgi:hypothetical protein